MDKLPPELIELIISKLDPLSKTIFSFVSTRFIQLRSLSSGECLKMSIEQKEFYLAEYIVTKSWESIRRKESNSNTITEELYRKVKYIIEHE